MNRIEFFSLFFPASLFLLQGKKWERKKRISQKCKQNNFASSRKIKQIIKFSFLLKITFWFENVKALDWSDESTIFNKIFLKGMSHKTTISHYSLAIYFFFIQMSSLGNVPPRRILIKWSLYWRLNISLSFVIALKGKADECVENKKLLKS